MISIKLELEYNGGDYADFYNAMKELQQGIDDIDNMRVKFCSTEEIEDDTKE